MSGEAGVWALGPRPPSVVNSHGWPGGASVTARGGPPCVLRQGPREPWPEASSVPFAVSPCWLLLHPEAPGRTKHLASRHLPPQLLWLNTCPPQRGCQGGAGLRCLGAGGWHQGARGRRGRRPLGSLGRRQLAHSGRVGVSLESRGSGRWLGRRGEALVCRAAGAGGGEGHEYRGG